MKRPPRVHVLLVNFNRWQDTVECLESVLRLEYPDLRVIVCDNASADGSLERLRAWADGRLAVPPAASERLRHLSSPPVPKPVAHREYDRSDAERGGDLSDDDAPIVFVRSRENVGFTGGNNAGLRYLLARGETGYVWLLNNDTVVAPDALRHLVETAERDAVIGVVGARLHHYARPDEVQAVGGGTIGRWNGVAQLLTEDADARAVAARLDYVTGASMLIPLAVLRTVGLLDERYFVYSEEADWCLRIRSRGLRFGYCPEAVIWHKEGLTMGRSSPFQDYLVVRNTLLLVHRFFARSLPTAALYSVYRSLLPKLLRGEWKRLTAVLRAYRDFAREAARGRRPDEWAIAPPPAVTRSVQRKAS